MYSEGQGTGLQKCPFVWILDSLYFLNNNADNKGKETGNLSSFSDKEEETCYKTSCRFKSKYYSVW